MSRRIEVELTSRRDDGTWTWRAAGAREPKGLVDAALLPAEFSVGFAVMPPTVVCSTLLSNRRAVPFDNVQVMVCQLPRDKAWSTFALPMSHKEYCPCCAGSTHTCAEMVSAFSPVVRLSGRSR